VGTTKKELVRDLWAKPYSLKRAYVMKRAIDGVYHDFDSELETPKMQLVLDLTAAGFGDLADKARNGDEKPTPAQIEEMRQELGPDVFDLLMSDKGRGDA